MHSRDFTPMICHAEMEVGNSVDIEISMAELISCDSQSCFREVETVGEQTFWNVPDRVDPLDSLVGIDF